MVDFVFYDDDCVVDLEVWLKKFVEVEDGFVWVESLWMIVLENLEIVEGV